MISVQVEVPRLVRQAWYWCARCELVGTSPTARCWYCGAEDVTVIGAVLVEVSHAG